MKYWNECDYDYGSLVNRAIIIEAADETFNDSALPLPGIVIKSSARFLTISDGPIDSFEKARMDFLFE